MKLTFSLRSKAVSLNRKGANIGICAGIINLSKMAFHFRWYFSRNRNHTGGDLIKKLRQTAKVTDLLWIIGHQQTPRLRTLVPTL